MKRKRRWGFVDGVKRTSGQAMVELSLIMTFLTVIAIAGTDFALGVSEYIKVVNATNAAAQYGSTGTSESTNTTAIATVAKNDLGSLYPASGGSITSSTADDGTGEGRTKVTVTVSIPYNMSMPFAGYFVPSFTLSKTAVLRVNPYGS